VLYEPGMPCQLYVCVNFVHYVMLLLANKMMMMMMMIGIYIRLPCSYVCLLVLDVECLQL